jgi:acetolactate synthase-1/2/3 large subunit
VTDIKTNDSYPLSRADSAPEVVKRAAARAANRIHSPTAEELADVLVSPVSMDAAELIVACLEKAGVEYVFGVPGGAVEPIYNALARSARRGGPRPVVARHESGAAFMADGYARETGRLGVCMATSGPGATNMITGVACAASNNVPVLAITGQPALPSFGNRPLQEGTCTGVDVLAMFGQCTRYNTLVSHVDQVETKVITAILQALRRPHGPSHISIPVDLLRSAVTPKNLGYDLSVLVRSKSCLVDERSVADFDSLLASASKPVFLIGEACSEAVDAIMTLVNLTGALFITTPDAKGLVNAYHQSYRGVFGFGGHASADRLLKEENPDLIVAFGTGFGELDSAGWDRSLMNTRLVHVDENEDNLIRSPMARLHVRGRIRVICDKLVASRLEKSGSARPLPADLGKPAGYGVSLHAPDKFHSDASPIKPQRLMKELSKRFPPTTRFLADSGNSMVWTAHYLQLWNRRGIGRRVEPFDVLQERRSGTASWLRIALEFCPMGWAIGAAVGIGRANPRCPVVCITGDGSYLMNGQEITTAVEECLPVIFVILNDHAYGMVMHGQRLAEAERIAFEIPKIDFRMMAEAMGVPAHVIESPADFDRIDFAAMLARKGPTLLDVRVDREEVPPMKLRLKTLGSVKG